MALTQRLEIRQSHALVMTPQLMQAIKLLQLSNLNLAAYVEGELERNPLLERTEEGEGERSPAGREVSPDAAPADWMQADRDQDQSSRPEQPAVDIDDVPPGDADAANSRANSEGPMGYSEWAGTGAGGRENGDYNLEAFVSVETTLADHVAQVFLANPAEPAQGRKIALGKQIQMSDERLHGRVESIALLELDGEALCEIARADARRIEALQDR